ncbi:PASTA domain-containing protein, partial [Nonomuraea sp. K271]
KTPTGTPSGSPTPTAVKKRVPKVVGMKFLDAQEIVLSMGFEVDLDDQTTTTAGLRCGTVKATSPKGGTEAEEGAQVTLVVVDSPCTPGSPSPTPSATQKR